MEVWWSLEEKVRKQLEFDPEKYDMIVGRFVSREGVLHFVGSGEMKCTDQNGHDFIFFRGNEKVFGRTCGTTSKKRNGAHFVESLGPRYVLGRVATKPGGRLRYWLVVCMTGGSVYLLPHWVFDSEGNDRPIPWFWLLYRKLRALHHGLLHQSQFLFCIFRTIGFA